MFRGNRRRQSSRTPKFGVLSAISGAYFSTPDSVASSVTGNIDIRIQVALSSWVPGTTSVLLTKDANTGAAFSRCYDLYVQAVTGKLAAEFSVDGTTNINPVSTVAPIVANNTILFVRVTRDTASGDVAFYTSVNGITWTQLGTTITGLTSGNLFDNNQSLVVGANHNGTLVYAGNIYRAQIYNGNILAVDFNPTDWVGPSSVATWPSFATGEIWTINGTASISV